MVNKHREVNSAFCDLSWGGGWVAGCMYVPVGDTGMCFTLCRLAGHVLRPTEGKRRSRGTKGMVAWGNRRGA